MTCGRTPRVPGLAGGEGASVESDPSQSIPFGKDTSGLKPLFAGGRNVAWRSTRSHRTAAGLHNAKSFRLKRRGSAMSEINVQLKGGQAAQVAEGATVAEALKAFDRDAAKRAHAARVNGREVVLSFPPAGAASNGGTVEVQPVLPGTLEGLDVIRHSTAHLLAAAVLDLFPGTKLGIGPALLEDPRYGFFYDVIAPRQLTEEDLPVIEKRMRELAKKNLAYRRDEIPKH